ncbi:MAG: acetylxylan esterase [Verrucomicrobiota bacterium]
MKYTNLILCALLLGCFRMASAETLPPLASDQLPKNISELYSGFNPDQEPLEVKVLKEWKEDGITLQMLTYTVGTFKGAKSIMGAYFAFPTQHAGRLSGLLYMHGGGQRAQKETVLAAAQNGYACISINWGGNKMDDQGPNDPGTDWGAVDATQKTHNDHYGSCLPDAKTIDAFESPRNNNWYLIVLAAKRAITFLQQQEVVDPARIGVFGHSMGGTLTVMVAGCDSRVKAAVPSCGGVGAAPEVLYARPGNAARPRNNSKIYMSLIDESPYIKNITCPILYLGPQNDFNGLFDELFLNWAHIGTQQVAFAISPHLNHRHEPAAAFDDYLWFQDYLQGDFQMPPTPDLQVELKGPNGLPMATLKADAPEKIDRAVIFYSIDPNGQFRFWRTAAARHVDDEWVAELPLLSADMPLYCIANVYYKFPDIKLYGPPWNKSPGKDYLLSSRLVGFEAGLVKTSGVKITDSAQRLITGDFANLQDWYELDPGNSTWHLIATRKIKDPKWRGPDGAELAVEVNSPGSKELVFTFNFNDYRQYGQDKVSGVFYTVVPLPPEKGWHTIKIKLSDLKPTGSNKPELPANWQTLCELDICGHTMLQIGSQRIGVGDGLMGDCGQMLKNLRWIGGEYPRNIIMPGGGIQLDPAAYQKQFQAQIDKSIELEKQVDQIKNGL